MGKTTSEKKADQIANGVEALKIDDTPRATSKNLDVLKEYEKSKAKNAANFVVIGRSPSVYMSRLAANCSRSCGCRQKYTHGPSSHGS